MELTAQDNDANSTESIQGASPDFSSLISNQLALESTDDSPLPPCPISSDSVSNLSQSSATESVSELGLDNDDTLSQQQQLVLLSYKLVGDNVDKEVRPREMRSDYQTQSLHYYMYQTYAVRDRVDLSNVSDQAPLLDISSIHLTDLLPTEVDNECIT